MSLPMGSLLPLAFGALLAGVAQARVVAVADAASLAAAIESARAGDEIVLSDGTYELHGSHGVNCTAPGTEAAPIVVRAAHPLRARILADTVEAFSVSAPHWHFEDLDVSGACADDAKCEHAFHVVGRAVGFRLARSRLADFNAQLKVNSGADHDLPDGGLVEGGEFVDHHPRATSSSVTPIDIDNASDWVVRGTVIRDFAKSGGNGVSYGAFVKGGAHRPVFERNLVLCADRDASAGERIGLSFGGGGMAPALCAPRWSEAAACDPEVTDGVMRNNVIANCSDDGIYLNRARATRILYNTLVATGGIEFRFPSSTGDAIGNLLSSTIRTRDGGRVDASHNRSAVAPGLFAAWFRDPTHGDLRLRAGARPALGSGPPAPGVAEDFCGRRRASPFEIGALQASLGDCATRPPGDG